MVKSIAFRDGQHGYQQSTGGLGLLISWEWGAECSYQTRSWCFVAFRQVSANL